MLSLSEDGYRLTFEFWDTYFVIGPVYLLRVDPYQHRERLISTAMGETTLDKQISRNSLARE